MFPDVEVLTHPWTHRVWMKLMELLHLFGPHFPITSYEVFDDGRKIAAVKVSKCQICGKWDINASIEVLQGADKGGS